MALHAANTVKNGDKSSQKEPSAAERAQEAIKQARKELKRGNIKLAREQYNTARTLDPKATGLRELEKDIAQAEQDAAREQRADKVDQLLDEAKVLLKKDEFDKAQLKVSEALELAPGDKDASKLRDKIKSESEKAAREKLEGAVDKDLDQAKEALKRNQFDLARRSLDHAREISNNLFAAEIGKMAADIDKQEAAATAKANEAKINDLLKSAEAYMGAGKYDLARQRASDVFSIKGQQSNKDASKLLAKIQKAEEAGTAKQKEREMQMRLADAEKLMKAKKYPDAVAAYEMAVKDYPASKEAKEGLTEARKQVAAANAASMKAASSNAKPAEKKEVAKATEKKKEVAKAPEKKAEQSKADMKKAEEAKKAEETKKAQEAKKAAEAKKAEEARKAAEAKKAEEVKKATEAKKMEEAKKAEEKKVAEVKKTEEPKKMEPAKQPEKMAEKAPEKKVEPAKKAETAKKAVDTSAANRAAEASAAKKAADEAAAKRAADAAAAEAEQKKRMESERAAREAEAKAKEAERFAAEQSRKDAEDRRTRAKDAYEQGVELYNQGELARARQRWLDAKEIDPTYTQVDVYLENTEKEYNEYLSKKAAQDDFDRREQEALEKMDTLIPLFRTTQPTSLPEFLQNLRIFSGIDFAIIGEVNAKVEAAFEDAPLREVLDSTLLPMGLRWYREPGTDTVIIEADLRTEVFTIPPDQLTAVDALIQQGVVARLLYGPSGRPVIEGQEVFTDPRQSILVITDSQQNIDKVRKILDSLTGQARTQLVFDSYQIDEAKAPEIKALLSAILQADNDKPYNSERKMILEGSTLIIKDTPENIQKVRNILQDQNFLKRFYSNELTVGTFNLTPVLEFEDNPDLIRSFADQVQQVVATLMFAREGRSKAESEGRRMWYDAGTLQLTVTETPDRLQTIQDYIESLPQIRSRRRSKIIFLDHAAAGDLVSQILAFLGISQSASGGGVQGDEVTKTMRVEDEIEFHGAYFRLTRVNDNDATDENDDSLEMIVRTNTSSDNVTIDEFQAEFVGDSEFEVVADDIKPSSTAGEGRARVIIRYVGNQNQNQNQQQQDQQQQSEEQQTEQLKEETGLTIEAIENLNAMFIQYENIEDLREVEFWVRTLDIPVLQVSVEVKFVEVLTNKAQQLAPEWVIGDLTQGFDFSDSVLGSRFAQDRDEYNSVFDPRIQEFSSANLLKGTTVLNYIVNNGNSPISFTLKALEAQGIINIVNGPTVTVLNGETVEFRIERRRATGIAAVETDNNTNSTNENVGDQNTPYLTPVDLSVEPTITRAGNITVDIQAEIEDYDENLGQVAAITPSANNAISSTTALPEAMVNAQRLGTLYKDVSTKARIRDGGTVVLGGWKSSRITDLESGTPLLRDIPFVGKYLFNRTQKTDEKITLLIFLTGQVVRD